MTRRLLLALALLSLALSATAQSDLKTKADAASGADKAKFALEYAEQAVKSADNAFKQGKDADGAAMLKDVANYAKIAADAAVESTKREKETEITLRKIVNHLVDLKNARPYDQQDAVQQTIDAVDNARNSILEALFRRKH
jgi:hypothetical protein